MDAVLQYISARRESYLERLITYLRQPSIAATGTGMAEAADLARVTMIEAGLEARLVDSPGYPFVIGTWLKKAGAPTVLLYGHYDVQPTGNASDWISPPFEPVVRGDRVFARGVGDNKGQHFAHLMAIEAHLRVAGELPCNVIFLLEGEEEVGSPHIRHFVETHRAELDADLVVVSDGSLHESGSPVIKYGCRGLLGIELIAEDASRDVHSGNFGGVVPNALWSLVHLLASMKDNFGNILVDGFFDNVSPPTAMELEAVTRLPQVEEAVKRELGLPALDQPLDRPYFERLMFNPTLTINGISGGYSGPGVKTIIPCKALAKLDIRLVEFQSPEEVEAKLKAHVRRFGHRVELRRLNAVPPSKTPMESPYAPAIRKAIADAHGQSPYEYPSGGGTLPLYVFTKIMGLHTFMVPYANHDEANHAPNENMTLKCFHDGIRTSAALLRQIGEIEAHGTAENEGCRASS